jgi:hypothetical protein
LPAIRPYATRAPAVDELKAAAERIKALEVLALSTESRANEAARRHDAIQENSPTAASTKPIRGCAAARGMAPTRIFTFATRNDKPRR